MSGCRTNHWDGLSVLKSKLLAHTCTVLPASPAPPVTVKLAVWFADGPEVASITVAGIEWMAGHSSAPVTLASMYSRVNARSIAGAQGTVQPVWAPASIAPSSLPHSGFPEFCAAVVLEHVVCGPAVPVG